MICFRAMTGKLKPAITQGQKLSILLARASSRAPALYGLVKRWLRSEELTSPPLWIASAACCGTPFNKFGLNVGDEKLRRYRAMKKTSFSAQQTNSTV